MYFLQIFEEKLKINVLYINYVYVIHINEEKMYC